MIFATVGTQLPFPRLVDALDRLAAAHGLDILAQTGAPGRWTHIEAHPRMTPGAFDRAFAAAACVVAHAGMGTVLTAQRLGKPLILMPRRADLGEHRNEHQRATVAGLRGRPGIHVAETEAALAALLLAPVLAPPAAATPATAAGLIGRLRRFIEETA